MESQREIPVKKSYRLPLFIAALLMFTLAACGGDASSDGQMSESSGVVEVAMIAVGDAGAAGGEAVIRSQGESIVVDVGADTGQGPGNYPTYIQEGTCSSPGAVAVELNDIVGAEPGDGEAQTTFPASQLSAGTTYSIVLQGRSGEPLICGDIPPLDFL